MASRNVYTIFLLIKTGNGQSKYYTNSSNSRCQVSFASLFNKNVCWFSFFFYFHIDWSAYFWTFTDCLINWIIYQSICLVINFFWTKNTKNPNITISFWKALIKTYTETKLKCYQYEDERVNSDYSVQIS